MSHTVKVTKIMDGPRNAIFHIYIKGDGISADIVEEIIIDPTQSFNPAKGAQPSITVDKIQYNLVGFDAELAFDNLVSNTPLWVLSGGQENKACFKDFGGLRDRSSLLDGTGKLLLNTLGLVDGYGVLLLSVRKE